MTSGTSNAPVVASSVPQNMPQARNFPEPEDDDTRQTPDMILGTSSSSQVVESFKDPEVLTSTCDLTPTTLNPPDHTNRPWLMVPADGPMGKLTH